MKDNITLRKLIIVTFAAVVFLSAVFTNNTNDQAAIIPFDKGIIAGRASWYSRADAGINRHTANMEIFDDHDLTCAMWDVPFNQKLRVTNLDNGKSVVVRVNDRGPHKRFVRQGRVVDLTKTAFKRIGGHEKGLIRVQVEFL